MQIDYTRCPSYPEGQFTELPVEAIHDFEELSELEWKLQQKQFQQVELELQIALEDIDF